MSEFDLGNGFSLKFASDFGEGYFIVSRDGESSHSVSLPKELYKVFEEEYKKQTRRKELRQFASGYKRFTDLPIFFQIDGHVEKYKKSALLLSSMPAVDEEYRDVQRFTFYLIEDELVVEGFLTRETPTVCGEFYKGLGKEVIYIDKETSTSLANFKRKFEHTLKHLPKCSEQ